MTRAEFNDAVFIYCNVLRARETSGFRTPEGNKKIGSELKLSPHVFGFGKDVIYDDLNTFNDPLRMEAARRLGLKLIPEGDHDHLQPLTWPPGDSITEKGVI